MSKGMKVCFLDTVHPSPFDIRMFYKEARTLSAAGYEMVLIVRHDRVAVVEGIRIVPLPEPRNRFDRATRLAWIAFRLALKQQADIYHFHRPELIPVSLLLRIFGKIVIYDVHEAFGEKILSKTYIKPKLRPIVSKIFSGFERISSKYFSHIIVADRFVAKQFKYENVTVVANYPVLSLIKKASGSRIPLLKSDGTTIAIYVGGLTKERGLFEMVEAVNGLASLDIELHLLGRFDDTKDEEIVKRMERVKYLGFLPLEKVFEHLMLASIGFALFQPVPAYLYAGENTNKLFEYMACGLAVIVSDFPNLRELVEANKCGICVDPISPNEVAAAIRLLYENPRMRIKMGENGRQAVLKKYNWENESQKLLTVYRQLLRRNQAHRNI